MAGEVPHEHYMTNDSPQAKDYMETATIIAGASGWKKLKFKVDEVNSILRYLKHCYGFASTELSMTQGGSS